MPRPHYQNRILASLPREAISRLSPHLLPVTLLQGQTLLAAGKKIHYAYFLEAGLASVVTTMKNKTSVEVAVVGKDGMVGLPALLDTGSMPNRAFIQIPGAGFRIKASALSREFEKRGKLRQKLQRYFQAHLVQASQTAACNRLHEISERLARWLLLCMDRIGSSELEITHQSLSDMLGTPRPTVTLAARTLQKVGLIEYSRGHVTILNRKGLEKASCECYGTIQKECRRLGIF